MGVNIENRFYFFTYAVAGVGISGGDRIFIEFAKRWSKGNSIEIYTSKEGERLFYRQNLSSKPIKVKVLNNQRFLSSFALNYLYKIFSGIILGLTLKISKEKDEKIYLYSASEFWMDSLPTFLLKIRYPKALWIAAWYQTAPNPSKGFAEGKREEVYRKRAFSLWLMQQPIKFLISRLADFVLVNNENEREVFSGLNRKKRVIVVLGAVNTAEIEEFKRKNPKEKEKWDAVFQGRFHPQKGVVELVDIWRKVVDKLPSAKLVMVGDGPLMEDVKSKIKKLGLENNIILLGYLFDGYKKYKTFSQSKMVLHPAFFDSGGMAAAEAMAFGLPAVGFNLSSYESYYPHGMVKVEKGNLEKFSGAIINLLANDKMREKMGREAELEILENWSWDTRAKQTLNSLLQIKPS